MAQLTRTLGAVLYGLLMAAGPASAQAPGCMVGKTALAAALGAPDLAGILTAEAASCDALIVHPDAVEFRLDEGAMPVYGGVRSEVAVDFPFNEGDTVRYEWELAIPADTAGDAPLNRWWLIAQWHDQPDKRLAQKWSDVPGRSPPLSIYVEERGAGFGIGLHANLRGNRSWTKMPRDAWLHVVVTIHWSRGPDGTATLEVAGHPAFYAEDRGANMYNGYQHYLKFGQYRDKKIAARSTVLYRHLRITTIPAVPAVH